MALQGKASIREKEAESDFPGGAGEHSLVAWVYG